MPFAPSGMQSFEEAYGISKESIASVDFTMCEHAAARGVVASLGGLVTTPLIGFFGVALRGGEAVDALTSFAGKANSSGVERAAEVSCGIAQLGGVLLSISSIAVALCAAVCSGVGGAACVFCFRRVRGAGSALGKVAKPASEKERLLP